MADNVETNPGAGGAVVATDDIGGVQYQRIKVVIGADGVNGGDVSSSNPMPVSLPTASSNALTSIAGMAVPAHDHITLGYTGSDVTSVTYRTGGAGGAVVATLTLAYSGGNLTTVTRT